MDNLGLRPKASLVQRSLGDPTQTFDPRHDADDPDPGWQCGMGIGRSSRAGRYRDTTG